MNITSLFFSILFLSCIGVSCASPRQAERVYFRSTDYKNEDFAPHIREAIRQGAKKIVLSRGDYLLESILEISGADGIQIIGHRSRLLLASVQAYKGPAILKIYNSNGIKLKNLLIDGRRDENNTPRLIHSIFIYNSSDLILKGITINNSLGDGIQIASNLESTEGFSRNILIKKCHVDNSGRNGISLINCNHVRILRSSFTHSHGEAPEAGIDIEPDEDKLRPGINYLVIKRVKCLDNAGNGIAIPHKGAPQHIRILKCDLQRNLIGIWTCGIHIGIKKCNIAFNRSYGICSIRYPEFNIPPDSIRISKNSIANNQLGIYYRGQGGIIEGNKISNTLDEGIEIRKNNEEEHSVIIRNNRISGIGGYSAIASDFDKCDIIDNRIRNCNRNGISLHRGINKVFKNYITSCDEYSILVNDAYCEIVNNVIKDGSKDFIWFNGFMQLNTSGTIENNKLIRSLPGNQLFIYDSSGRISKYLNNSLKIAGDKKGTVVLRKLPPEFNDKDQAVEFSEVNRHNNN
ncbi:MAG: right-handed parallel beta-helix repeat-containing protein [Saprospiraceae bacterium]